MNEIIKNIEAAQLKAEVPAFTCLGMDRRTWRYYPETAA